MLENISWLPFHTRISVVRDSFPTLNSLPLGLLRQYLFTEGTGTNCTQEAAEAPGNDHSLSCYKQHTSILVPVGQSIKDG